MAIDQWTRRTQDATYATATHHGEGWTSRDLDFVSAFAGDVSDAERQCAPDSRDIGLRGGRIVIAAQRRP